MPKWWGVTDTELDRGRRMVGEMVNVKKRHSTTASLFTMPGYVDPIFKGTIPLVKLASELVGC